MDPRKARALARIASEHLLLCRDALDSIGRGISLSARQKIDDDDIAQVNNLMQSLQQALPDGVRELAALIEQEDGGIALSLDGGTVVGAAVLGDPNDAPWLMVAIVNVLPVENLDDITDEDVDIMNARMPGLLFMVRDDYAAYATGIGKAFAEIDRDWVELVAELVVETHTRSQLFQRHALGRQDDEDPVVRYQQAESLYLADRDELRYRLPQSLEQYHRSIPEGLRDLVEIRQAPGAATIEVPFYQRERPTTFRISCELRDVDSDQEPWTPAGLHLRFDSNEPMSEREALDWARRLNGAADTTEKDVYTMPWLMGNWCTNGHGQGTVLCYQAFVSNAAAGRVDLDKVIDGAVREVWEALNKLRLHREFEETVRRGGLDVP